jgi:hypothetical protein
MTREQFIHRHDARTELRQFDSFLNYLIIAAAALCLFEIAGCIHEDKAQPASALITHHSSLITDLETSSPYDMPTGSGRAVCAAKRYSVPRIAHAAPFTCPARVAASRNFFSVAQTSGLCSGQHRSDACATT